MQVGAVTVVTFANGPLVHWSEEPCRTMLTSTWAMQANSVKKNNEIATVAVNASSDNS